uniref:HORMA domain-containing protein n=1 Tax=Ascaris lumbricoides TaxID=6252 RepID=A0A0M3I7V0_ASCLU
MSDLRDTTVLQQKQGRDSTYEDVEEGDAVRFLVGAIAGVASAVLIGRNLVSKKDVTLRKMKGYDMKLVRKNTEAGIVFWNTMEGISDVIAKRYLREVVIAIAAGSHEDDETLEAYVITIYYPQEGERIVLKDLRGTEVATIAYKGGEAAREDIVRLFRNVVQFIDTLSPLPDYAIGHFRVSYYPNKPRGYTPQGFIPTKKVRSFSGSVGRVVLGAVNVRFLGCSLHVELPVVVRTSKASSGKVQRNGQSGDGRTVVTAASAQQREGPLQGHVSTSMSLLETAICIMAKRKSEQYLLLQASGIGTMTVDTGEHGKARRPLPPVLAKETSEAVRSAESGVEVSRADDEHDRSLQFEVGDEVLVREFNVGREKLRRFAAKKRRQEEKARHLVEHEKREAIYRSLARERNEESVVSSDSVGAKTTVGSSGGTTAREIDLSTNSTNNGSSKVLSSCGIDL